MPEKIEKSEQKKHRYTKYEKTRIISARALQIAYGAPILIKLSDEDLKKINYSPIEISKMEFNKGILPITIKRPMPVRAVVEE